MTLSMLEAIRMEDIQIQLTLTTPDGGPVAHFEPSDFVCVRVVVKNVSCEHLHFPVT